MGNPNDGAGEVKMKKILFYFLLVLLPLSVLIIGTYVATNLIYAKSDYELTLENYKKYEKSSLYKDIRARSPYVMFRPRPGDGDINSLGFRSPEIPKEKSKDDFRIAILGSSVAFNGLPTYKESIIGLLAGLIKNDAGLSLKNKNIQYINAGIVGSVSGQDLTQLIFHVLPLNIDLLIVFNGFNDFSGPVFSYGDPRLGYPYDYVVEEYRYYNFITRKTWSEKFLALFNPKFFDPAAEKKADYYFKGLGKKKPDISPPGIANIYIENIKKIGVIANAYGIPTAIFLQPYSPKHVYPEYLSGRQFLEIYARVSKELKNLSGENSPDLNYHDFSTLFHDQPDMFLDPAHFKYDPGGNVVVAQKIFDEMKKEGMFDKYAN